MVYDRINVLLSSSSGDLALTLCHTGHREKVAICEPGTELSPEPAQTGTPIYHFQPLVFCLGGWGGH